MAAIVPFGDLKLIEEIEDRLLQEKAKKALKEKRRISLTKVKKELGF